MNEDSIADAFHEYTGKDAATGKFFESPFLYASYVSAEVVDPNLSKIRVADGTVISGVPKLRSVTGLSYGLTLLCANPGSNKVVTIIGILEGNITLYEAP